MPNPQSGLSCDQCRGPPALLLHVCCTRRHRGGVEVPLHLMKGLLIGYRRRDSNPGFPSPVTKSVVKSALTSANGADFLPKACTDVYRSGPKRPEMLHVCCTERWPDGADETSEP